MQIDNLQNNHFPKLDISRKYIPIVSTVVSAIIIIAKTTLLQCVSERTIQDNNYLRYFSETSYQECVWGLIPIIGNIVLCLFFDRVQNDDPLLDLNQFDDSNLPGDDEPYEPLPEDPAPQQPSPLLSVASSIDYTADTKPIKSAYDIGRKAGFYTNATPGERQQYRKQIYEKLFPLVPKENTSRSIKGDGYFENNGNLLNLICNNTYPISIDPKGNVTFGHQSGDTSVMIEQEDLSLLKVDPPESLKESDKGPMVRIRIIPFNGFFSIEYLEDEVAKAKTVIEYISFNLDRIARESTPL